MRVPVDDLATLARRTAVATAVAVGVAACLVGLGYVVDVVLIAFAGLLVALLLRGLAGSWRARPACRPGGRSRSSSPCSASSRSAPGGGSLRPWPSRRASCAQH